MIIIGEKLNSSIPKTLEAFKIKDEQTVISLIKAQEKGGAAFIDINTALCQNELETMVWAINLVLQHSSCGIMIDSPSPSVAEQSINYCKGREVILNSVTLTDRLLELAPIAAKYGASVVALPIGGEFPKSVEERVNNALLLRDKLVAYGISPDKIYMDILVQAIGFEPSNGMDALNTLRALKEKTDIKTLAGLSNISFGLPKRALINSGFLTAGVMYGLESAIMDNTSPATLNALYAANAIAGKDEYCMDYITHIRCDE